MFEKLLGFVGNFNEALIVVLVVLVFILVQYILNKRQTKEIGGNHLHTVNEGIKRIEDGLRDLNRNISDAIIDNKNALAEMNKVLIRLEERSSKRK